MLTHSGNQALVRFRFVTFEDLRWEADVSQDAAMFQKITELRFHLESFMSDFKDFQNVFPFKYTHEKLSKIYRPLLEES